jgi:hypothetical protein
MGSLKGKDIPRKSVFAKRDRNRVKVASEFEKGSKKGCYPLMKANCWRRCSSAEHTDPVVFIFGHAASGEDWLGAKGSSVAKARPLSTRAERW